MKGYKAGPRLTLKTARELALKVTGTAKGLAKDKTLAIDLYEMRLGELSVKIRYDWYGSGCISGGRSICCSMLKRWNRISRQRNGSGRGTGGTA